MSTLKVIRSRSSVLIRVGSCRFLRVKVLGDFCVAGVLRPVGGCGVPEDVFLIEPGASFDEEMDELFVTGSGGLVQGCGVRVAADGIEAVGILTGVQKQADDFDMAILRCQGECQVAGFAGGGREQAAEIVQEVESGGDGKIDAGAALEQGVDGFQLAVQGGGLQSAVWLRSVIAEQIYQGKLQAAFARNAAGGDEHEGFVARREFDAGVENDPGDFHDVAGQSAVANGIFSDEFQQSGISEIVSAFEYDAASQQPRVLFQMNKKSRGVAGIDEIDGTAKCGVFNSLVVRQSQLIGESGFFDVVLEARPAWKSILAGDGELRVTEA